MMTAEQLKNSILQLALQGRLVDQNPADESAQKLLERIRAEKKTKIKAGTIPNDKKMEDVSEDEQLFDLPENWIWTRMGELFQHNTGKALNGTNKDGEVLTYITTSNLYWNKFELDNLKSMPFTESEVDKYTVTKGDLLVCEGGDYGRAAIWNYDFDMRIQNHVHRLRAYLPLCTEYFYYVINFLKGTGLIKGKGIAIQGLSSGALHNLVVPLPPLEEQKRIVAKIEELMPFVEQYAKVSTRLNTLNASFPDQMKKSILQQAVMGKLVPQDPSDEPASVLLKKLVREKKKLSEAGKIYKKKPTDPFYEEDTRPFDVPESWEWVQLSDVSLIQEGAGIRKFQYRVSGIQLFSVTNILEGDIDLEKKQLYVSTEEFMEKYQHLRLNKGDIVTACSGGSWGKSAIYNEEDEVMLNTSTLRLRFFGDLADNLYLYYLTKSELFKKQLREQLVGMQPNFGYAHYSRICFPLPPLKEQHRIVEQLERILKQVDAVEWPEAK